jgi:2-phosphoglycerate kinase
MKHEVRKMIVLITGASHTGKTLLAQKILAKYHVPYLSIDLLKMGLIRSKYTDLTPEDDAQLQMYLWPVLREMIKTAIENRQNLVIEGGYIPGGWEEGFSDADLKQIRYYCLVMSRRYIQNHFSDIKAHACDAEKRIDDAWCTMQNVLEQNAYYLNLCRKHKYPYLLIDEAYQVDVDLPIENM